MSRKPRTKKVPITLPEIDGAKCAECFYKRAANGAWSEFVPCALHKAPAPPEPAKRKYRVVWKETYSQDREAEDASTAMEQRDDENSFEGCEDVDAYLVCPKCDGAGGACKSCKGRGVFDVPMDDKGEEIISAQEVR